MNLESQPQSEESAWEFPDRDLREPQDTVKPKTYTGMNKSVLIVGASGTGKSASLRNLDPKETFIINVASKPLPFRRSGYSVNSKDNPSGNVFSTDKAQSIVQAIQMVNGRKEIKYLIVDDAQYVMANDYMTNAMVKGYEKFSKLAQDFFNITKTLTSLRSDLHVALLFHEDVSQGADGKKTRNAKTIGKMFDQYITLEGLFSVVLFTNTVFKDKKMNYGFSTQTDGETTAKSPMGLFEERQIDNDLKIVFDKMDEYYADEFEEQVVEVGEPSATQIQSIETIEDEATVQFSEITGPGYPAYAIDLIDLIQKNEDVLKTEKVKGWMNTTQLRKSRAAFCEDGSLMHETVTVGQLQHYLKSLRTTIETLPE